ncbi:condensation domain-containing protein [Nocardia vulneris]|uniref:condensation domain-containing protein n=1 Tax=Nocardia vulneris TaxID=1141657 RepID=UPI0030D0C9DA
MIRIGGVDFALRPTRRPIIVAPTAASARAAKSAPTSAVPPSFLQQDHLDGVLGGISDGVYLGMVTRISGALDLAALTVVITDFVQAHDGLRTWFEPTALGCIRHILAPEDVQFGTRELAGAEGDWAVALTDYFDAVSSPLQWPSAAFAVLPGAEGFEVVFAVDHAFSDGMSQALAALELTERYRARTAGRAAAWPGPGGSSTDYAADERARASDALAADLYPYWQDALAENDFRLPVSPIERGGPAPKRHRRRVEGSVLLDADLVQAFDEALARTGASVAAAMFSVLALADFETTGSEFYWSLNVLSTRFGARFRTAQGWFCNFVPVSFELPPVPSFAATLPIARDALERGRQMSRLPAHGAIAQLFARGYGADLVTREPSFVTLLDLRTVDEALGAEADTRILTADGTTSTVSIWLGRNNTEYFVCIGAPDLPETWEQAGDYVQRLRRILVSIAETGDYRSACPLAAISGIWQ